MQGDNPHNSTDSRNYGAVPLGLVKSRVLLRVWPLSAIAAIPRCDPRDFHPSPPPPSPPVARAAPPALTDALEVVDDEVVVLAPLDPPAAADPKPLLPPAAAPVELGQAGVEATPPLLPAPPACVASGVTSLSVAALGDAPPASASP